MAGNQKNAHVMYSNYGDTDTSKSSINRKRKARDLMPEPPAPRVVNESMVKLQFEKKLTHTDVEGQDRIIIPKAYAETVFPETTTKPCLYFMDDMASTKVWAFWIRNLANGASKIYVLEGTAEYIKEQGIKEGDYIKIYRDYEIERFAIGWRKHDNDLDKCMSSGVKKVELAAAPCSDIALDDKNTHPAISSDVASFVDDYHPHFSPVDETYQVINDIIDPEYVQKNFNISWDEFQEFNPFDFP